LNGDWGPGSAYVGDEERWNWRWLLIGVEVNDAFDAGVLAFFNDQQRELMRQPPMDVIDMMLGFMPDSVTDAVLKRAAEAHVRLFPPKIAAREGNVITGNFGKRKC
jgi:hypothetical protein